MFLKILQNEIRSTKVELVFMFEYFWNTLLIIWADLWIRQNEFHWTNDSLGYLYRNSFFSSSLRERSVTEDGVVEVKYSLFTSKLLARREISHRIDDEKHPFKTFFLRQRAWFKYRRTSVIPRYVFQQS